MHEWLDRCGIFEVNVSMQIADDQKSACSNSPESRKYWADLQSKNRSSPSFLQKRRMQNAKLKGLSISIVETQLASPVAKTKRSASIIDVNNNPKSEEQLETTPEPHSALKRKHLSLSTFAGCTTAKMLHADDFSSQGPLETNLHT